MRSRTDWMRGWLVRQLQAGASRRGAVVAGAVLALAIAWGPVQRAWGFSPMALAHRLAPRLFQTSDGCMACHNGLMTTQGEDVSIGTAWRATMMANSARDPYWQASVRREVLDHPTLRASIEDECSKCHMPMMRYQAHADGGAGAVFANLPIDGEGDESHALAADGVSCTLCHQVLATGLGRRESFVGGFSIDQSVAEGARSVFGPHRVDEGRRTIMRSSSGYLPTEGDHMRSSELCATCHTLYTTGHDAAGAVVGSLPEQVPYLEWKRSRFAGSASCQSCHMPVARGAMGFSSVWGEARDSLSRHDFRGGNFFILRMLNRHRGELGVRALSQELEGAATRTEMHLATAAAEVRADSVHLDGTRLHVAVAVHNLGGHKLPTAYPSRRAWLHVQVRDGDGHLVFESGAPRPDGSIAGNDNDVDGRRFEPHYRRIDSPSQVQIYESVMADANGVPTTGLLSAVRFVKDNRLLPDGFAREGAPDDVAVRGEAASDPDFDGGGDRVDYDIDVGSAAGPFDLSVTLRFQPIAFRWARNLGTQPSEETNRFGRYYAGMSAGASTTLASVRTTVAR